MNLFQLAALTLINTSWVNPPTTAAITAGDVKKKDLLKSSLATARWVCYAIFITLSDCEFDSTRWIIQSSVPCTFYKNIKTKILSWMDVILGRTSLQNICKTTRQFDPKVREHNFTTRDLTGLHVKGKNLFFLNLSYQNKWHLYKVLFVLLCLPCVPPQDLRFILWIKQITFKPKLQFTTTPRWYYLALFILMYLDCIKDLCVAQNFK